MNIFKLLLPAIDALKYGKELNNSLVWKDRQSNINILFALLSALATIAALGGFDLGLSEQQIMSVAGGVSTIGTSVFNWYMTKATSPRTGVGPPKKGEKVMQRDECPFVYCPHPERCKERCTNTNQ